MDLTQVFATYLPLIDAEMREVLAIPLDAAAGHYQIMQYHMGWLDAEL